MKSLIAISGHMGKSEIPINETKCNQVEWIVENKEESETIYSQHFAVRWKETSKTVYFKWIY